MNCLSIDLCGNELMQHIVEECDNPIFSGIDAAGVIINYDDIDSIVRDASNKHIITSIILKSGKHAWRFVQERNNPFTGTNTAAEVGDFRNAFTATVAGFIPFDGAEPSRNVITPMANGRYVVIVRNQWQHTDSNGDVDNEWQVYGSDKGLKMSSLQQTRYENNDAWMIEMQEQGISRASTFFIPQTCAAVTDTSSISDATFTDGAFTGSIVAGSETLTYDNATATPLGGDRYSLPAKEGSDGAIYNVTIRKNAGAVMLESVTRCEVADACNAVQSLITGNE